MTLRDKIIDKYWLTFVDHHTGNEYVLTERYFWGWFYRNVVLKDSANKNLEHYLALTAKGTE